MLNYLRSELYRNLRSKSNFYFLFGSILFVIFINVALGLFARSQVAFPYGTTKYALSSFYSLMAIPFFLCPIVAINVFGQEYKNNTMKNALAFGITRHTVYGVKLLLAVMSGLISLFLISCSYILAAYVMLEHSEMLYLHELLYALLACTPLYILAVVSSNAFSFKFEKEKTATTYWMIIMFVIPQLFALAGRGIPAIKKIAEWLPFNIAASSAFDESTQKLMLKWQDPELMIKCLIVGLVGSVLFYIIGLSSFNRKEIK